MKTDDAAAYIFSLIGVQHLFVCVLCILLYMSWVTLIWWYDPRSFSATPPSPQRPKLGLCCCRIRSRLNRDRQRMSGEGERTFRRTFYFASRLVLVSSNGGGGCDWKSFVTAAYRWLPMGWEDTTICVTHTTFLRPPCLVSRVFRRSCVYALFSYPFSLKKLYFGYLGHNRSPNIRASACLLCSPRCS